MRLKPVQMRLWRAVEAQHRVSTLRLVDNDPEDQEVLERILEDSKPKIPAEAQNLGYLLSTPFRYRSPYGSRFRGPFDPGVFYGAQERRTACAELGYWRWRFAQESAGLGEIEATAQTVFQSGIKTRAADLRSAPYAADRARWTHPSDYGPTQAFGREARDAGAGVILYESVRDPEHAVCGAVLEPQAFRPTRPVAQETWFLTITQRAALWTREKVEFVFGFS